MSHRGLLILVAVSWVRVATATQCDLSSNPVEGQVRGLERQFAAIAKKDEAPETRQTKTGAVFTRVSGTGLGESWLDPSGMIWGDVAKNPDGSFQGMSQSDAKRYCESLGALLPSEQDFIRLRQYLGAGSDTHEGYSPQILPHLFQQDADNRKRDIFFWSSSTHPQWEDSGIYFGGLQGILYFDPPPWSFQVRCVIRR